MDNYNQVVSRNKCTTDTFTIYEEDSRDACDVIFTMTITNKRPISDTRRLNYGILYEIVDENITRICGVVNRDQISKDG